ncbi:MAG: hypothetical protein AAF203_03130 [Pseudomonadota bacterium]
MRALFVLLTTLSCTLGFAAVKNQKQLQDNTTQAFVGCGKPSQVWAGTYKAKKSKHPNETFCVTGFDFFGADSQLYTLRFYFNSTDKEFTSIKTKAEADVKKYNNLTPSKKVAFLKKMTAKYRSLKTATLSLDYYQFSIEKAEPVVKKMVEYQNNQVTCQFASPKFNPFGNILCNRLKGLVEIDVIVKTEKKGQKLYAFNFPSIVWRKETISNSY